MQIKIHFLGAAENVTGSRHLLEINGYKILVDCGLYQERDFRDRNWDPFPIPPSQINAVLLTHATGLPFSVGSSSTSTEAKNASIST